MDLPGIHDFVLVASSGSFGSASRKSGRPKATLSRRVIGLEESLGVRLFERGSRALKLTDDGLELFTRTEGLLGELREVQEQIRSGRGEPHGRLRISAPMLFSHLAMGRVAAEFSARYPQVQLEVTAEDRKVDLIEDGYDAVVRINPPPDSGLVGRCILKDHLIVVAAPTITKPKAGQPFPAVLMTGGSDEPSWPIEGSDKPFRPRAVLRLSSLIMIRDAVRAGAGASLLPEPVVRGDLASGRLVSWGVRTGPPVEIWVLHASRRLMSGKVRAFVDFLGSAFPDGVLA